jgi:hypothetical protein
MENEARDRRTYTRDCTASVRSPLSSTNLYFFALTQPPGVQLVGSLRLYRIQGRNAADRRTRRRRVRQQDRNQGVRRRSAPAGRRRRRDRSPDRCTAEGKRIARQNRRGHERRPVDGRRRKRSRSEVIHESCFVEK